MEWIIALGAGIVVGYFLGRRSRAQSGHDLFDPEEAAEFSGAGHAAVAERLERRKARIMEKAQAQGRITNDDVEDLFCIGNTTATNYLRTLVEEGKLAREGEGRGTYYRPTA